MVNYFYGFDQRVECCTMFGWIGEFSSLVGKRCFWKQHFHCGIGQGVVELVCVMFVVGDYDDMIIDHGVV